MDKICRAEGLPPKRITPEAEDHLCRCAWPGNVRQLENSIETAVALSGGGPLLVPADFPPQTAGPTADAGERLAGDLSPDGGLDYESTLAGIEKSIIEQALLRTGGNKKAAADMLRLKRTTLSAKARVWRSDSRERRSPGAVRGPAAHPATTGRCQAGGAGGIVTTKPGSFNLRSKAL